MNVLVIGSGGREHAIVKKFRASRSVQQVFAAPGNDGMVHDATCVNIAATDVQALVTFAKENAIELTFVGPENALSAGVVDVFREADLMIFGPTQAAAQLESSKSFAKDFMKKHSIPTAAYETFTEVEAAKAFAEKLGAPCVIKADGLAAGKGVVVAETLEEAFEAIDDMLGNAKFGDASSKVVIEEFLAGEEFSFMSFVHENSIVPMPIAQDHKRAYDGDKGPNTGGMGAYSPVPQISEDIVAEAFRTIVEPTVSAMTLEGNSFTGVLYAGLIATVQGPKVIEFNVRFGDPETQVVLPRLESDLTLLLLALLRGEDFAVEWSEKARLGVVIASEGYPDAPVTGQALPQLTEDASIEIIHSGTKQVDGQFVANGGRVLFISSEGETLKEAQQKVYTYIDAKQWEGFHYRKDIGWRTFNN